MGCNSSQVIESPSIVIPQTPQTDFEFSTKKEKIIPEKLSEIKIILVGDSFVGKTAMTNKFLNLEKKDFFHGEYKCTVAADFHQKKILLNEKERVLRIWDTAGQEKFQSITTNFYRQTQAAIIVFDITDRESFNQLKTWIESVDRYTQNCQKIIVGNKTDLHYLRQVEYTEAEDFAKSLGLPYAETSAKNGIGLIQAFEILIKNLDNLILNGIESK
eukprot:TRINITY_DN1373_c0_g1_i2.p1 TRINITY_DN1373_c0_g1~~TRINITY_DN1373_c0_g1_i2.p1  ORF type:complete len:216 (-),score=64.17 TRINITY_DN1373_c0_g1_i2:134-781(-)